MSAGLVLQVLIAGAAAGVMYGLVALGFSLVQRLTGVLQLAHGDFVGAATFLAIAVAAGTGPVTRTNVGGARYAAGVVAAVAAAAVGGALLFAALRSFIRREDTVGWVAATVALSFAVQGVLAVAFPREAYVVPDPSPLASARPLDLGGGAALPPRTIAVLAVGLALAAVVAVVLRRSTFGRALEAIASERTGAALVGLPVDRMVAGAFALAGALAAFAGVVGLPSLGTLAPATGALLGLKAIAASLVAGAGRPARAFAVAISIGVIEAVVASLHVPGFPRLALGAAWRDVFPLALAVLVVALRARPEMRETVE